MGNDQFYQALSPRDEHSLESSAVSTAHKIALRWFYVSTWAWQPYAMLSLKSPDNAIRTGASHFHFCFEVLINFSEVVLLYNALRSCAVLILLEKGWLTTRELNKHRVSFCLLYMAMQPYLSQLFPPTIDHPKISLWDFSPFHVTGNKVV